MNLVLDPNLPPVLELRSLRPSDRYEVIRLWERRVGVGIENTLDLVFDEETGVHGLAVTEAERVVGFGVVMLLSAAGVEEYFAVPTADYPIGERNAVLHAGVVAEAWEGRGIGSELMRLRLALAREVADVAAAFGKAWLRPHRADVSVLFETHGFERLETIENAYERPSGDRDCPDCSPEPCTCSAAVYAKVFDG